MGNTLNNINYVVFDVGGVLVELIGVEKFLEWTRHKYKEPYEFYEAWIRSPAVRQFECGKSSKAAFIDAVIAEMELPVSATTFHDEFLSWPNGLLTGFRELLPRV